MVPHSVVTTAAFRTQGLHTQEPGSMGPRGPNTFSEMGHRNMEIDSTVGSIGLWARIFVGKDVGARMQIWKLCLD